VAARHDEIRAAGIREVVVFHSPAEPEPPGRPAGGRLGLPGDFLIVPDGRVVASRIGSHAGDQWSVDELLALVPSTV